MMAEKFCPVCKYKNETGATVCAYCGSPLEDGGDENPTTTKNVEMETNILPHAIQELMRKPFEMPERGVAIYTTASEAPITISDNTQFILGRKMTGEIDDSFVDLKPYGAYENGVSRRHAMIQRTSTGYEIMDLGSTNGTWLEKQRLIPNKAYPLNNISRIFLGRMQLIVIFQTKNSAAQ
jgi:hypothetical protein